jgi:excisionase family DNA binding protein
VGSQTIYRSIYRGQLKALRIGGQWRIPECEFQRLISTGTGEP